MAVNVPLKFAKPNPGAPKLAENTFAGSISMFNCCEELVIVTLVCVLSAPRPTLNDVVDTCKHAMFAEITTLPVG